MNHLKIYPPPQQTYESFGDITSTVYEYIYDSQHTNQQRLMRLLSSTEMPTDFIECYEAYRFGGGMNFQTMSPYSSKYAILRMHWYREKDMWRWDKEGSENFIPNVMLYALEINQERFDQFFDLFTKARISIFPNPFEPEMMGNDGTNYELTFGDGFFLGVTYKWWEDTPGTWKQLADNAMTAKGLVDTWIAEYEKSQGKS